jgi:hypothetical protein
LRIFGDRKQLETGIYTQKNKGEAMHTVTLLKRAGIVIALVVLGWIPVLNAATDGSSTERTVNTLLTAIATNNYNALIANAAPALKTRITKETFTQVSTQLSPRLKKGYKLQYLGSLKQHEVEVFLWKIIYQDGGDDLLARLVIQEDKVAGFWFQ